MTWFNCLLGSEVECESNDRKKRWNVDLANAIAGDVGNNDLIYDSDVCVRFSQSYVGDSSSFHHYSQNDTLKDMNSFILLINQ